MERDISDEVIGTDGNEVISADDNDYYATNWRQLEQKVYDDIIKNRSSRFPCLVANSPVMQKLYARAYLFSQCPYTLLIEGAPGTGKDILVQMLRRLSNNNDAKRGDNNFVRINCAAIPENLLESELFGHKKGAFTGAVCDKKGLVEDANGGMLFLDEIQNLSLPLQAKLLIFIQKGVFRRVGDNSERSVKTRIVCATNQNLERLVLKGVFREDLLQRISGHRLGIPSLDKRKEDIPGLAKIFLGKSNESFCVRFSFEDSVLEYLQKRDWNENVRGLKRFIEALFSYRSLCRDEIFTLDFVKFVEKDSHSFPEKPRDDFPLSVAFPSGCPAEIRRLVREEVRTVLSALAGADDNRLRNRSSDFPEKLAIESHGKSELMEFAINIAEDISNLILKGIPFDIKLFFNLIRYHVVKSCRDDRPTSLTVDAIARMLGYKTPKSLYNVLQRMDKE